MDEFNYGHFTVSSSTFRTKTSFLYLLLFRDTILLFYSNITTKEMANQMKKAKQKLNSKMLKFKFNIIFFSTRRSGIGGFQADSTRKFAAQKKTHNHVLNFVQHNFALGIIAVSKISPQIYSHFKLNLNRRVMFEIFFQN